MLFTTQFRLVILGQISATCSAHDIGNKNFVSFHSCFLITDFDEVPDMQCWHYFSHSRHFFKHFSAAGKR